MTQRKREWFDDDSFWRELYPFMFPEKRFTDTAEQIEKILALTRPVGKAALDLCCGPGRCGVALAKKGFDVTGVDRTKFHLAKARAIARAANVKVEWVEADMRDFVRPDSFDPALSMFTSFGYFDAKTQDINVISNILNSLRLAGLFIIDVMGKELLTKVPHPKTSEPQPDGTVLVQLHEVIDNQTRIRNEWILLRNGKVRSFKFYHNHYSGQELRDLLEQVGFIDVRLYGTLAGDEYGPNAQRLIAVARKPEEPAKKNSRTSPCSVHR